jgi:hypothetical protein
MEHRPPVAFVDDESLCLVCVARHRRQEAVTTRLFEADQEQARKRQKSVMMRAARMKARGSYRPGRPTTMVVPKAAP